MGSLEVAIAIVVAKAVLEARPVVEVRLKAMAPATQREQRRLATRRKQQVLPLELLHLSPNELHNHLEHLFEEKSFE